MIASIFTVILGVYDVNHDVHFTLGRQCLNLLFNATAVIISLFLSTADGKSVPFAFGSMMRSGLPIRTGCPEQITWRFAKDEQISLRLVLAKNALKAKWFRWKKGVSLGMFAASSKPNHFINPDALARAGYATR